MSTFKFKHFTKINSMHSVDEGLLPEYSNSNPGAETTEVEACVTTSSGLCCYINGRQQTGSKFNMDGHDVRYQVGRAGKKGTHKQQQYSS